MLLQLIVAMGSIAILPANATCQLDHQEFAAQQVHQKLQCTLPQFQDWVS